MAIKEIALLHQIVDIRPDLHPVHSGHDAIGRQLVQPQLEHPLVPAPPEHSDNGNDPQAGGILPLHPGDGGEDLLCLHSDIPLLQRPSAAAAFITAIRGILPKIAQQIGPQAAGGLAVGCHFLQTPQVAQADLLPLPFRQLLVFGGAVDEEFRRSHVAF